MPTHKTDKTTAPLPQSMVTGKASAAKAAAGDKPVFAWEHP